MLFGTYTIKLSDVESGCVQGVHWFTEFFAESIQVTEWTPDKQRQAVYMVPGIMRWLKWAYDAGLLPMWSFAEANLTEANLRRADLTEANLHGANLTEANLTEANLTEADLHESKGLV